MKSKSIKIAHLMFNSKKDAIIHFKEILNYNSLNVPLMESSYKDVEALIYNHPRYQDKIKNGIKQIIICSDKYKGRCFHIVRNDNTIENFSYLKCINGDASPFTLFSIACRKIVENDVIKFKQEYFLKNQDNNGNVKCELTNEFITIRESHVDHFPLSFALILDRFIKYYNINIKEIKYIKDGLYGHILADQNLREQFLEWHKKYAQYRIIKDKINLSLNAEAKRQLQMERVNS